MTSRNPDVNIFTDSEFITVITVLADQNHYQLERYLHPSVRLVNYDPLTGWDSEQLGKADAILVRTTSPIRRGDIPEGCKLSFVGTASAGRDHLDVDFLAEQKIHVADAKGSNANSVAEYAAVAILHYLESIGATDKTTGFPASGNITAGIVGAGYTGSAVTRMLESIGIRCLQYDPPRERREQLQHKDRGIHPDHYRQNIPEQPATNDIKTFRSVSLDDVLSCDILSFHVPLERSGPDATWHWYDEAKIRSYPKKLVINASRGGVVDEDALRKAHHDRHVKHFICDVWENEPVFSADTAQRALIATPHIAGYSVEAKREATRMMCKQLHNFFNIPEPEVPPTPPQEIHIPEKNLSITEIIRFLHPVFHYDKSLRSISGMPDTQKGTAFLKLRQDIPLRHEFHQLALPESIIDRYPVLRKIGIAAAGNSKQVENSQND